MPRRMITPDIWRNEKFGNLDDASRLFFIGCFSNADDDGRLKASPKYLKALIFPYDEDKNSETVLSMRNKCHEAGLVHIYNTNGSEFLYCIGWEEHQSIRKDRYQKSKLPPPNTLIPTKRQPSDNRTDTELSPDNSPRLPQYSIDKYSIDKYSIDNIFEHFWSAYPKKKSKQYALKVFKKINPDEQLLSKMLKAIEKAKKTKEWQKDNGQFIPHPATWLNRGCWEDDYNDMSEDKDNYIKQKYGSMVKD